MVDPRVSLELKQTARVLFILAQKLEDNANIDAARTLYRRAFEQALIVRTLMHPAEEEQSSSTADTKSE
ncbi:MAG TPA: hypothetical protein V6C81_13600 [Planktothrix sp.]